jgi:RNA polymerase sigma-70 factor, ECF subfamily
MQDSVPDETLMARYVDGDSRAFEELFARYEPRAYVYFLRRTGSRERAEDLYQALFLRVHRARAGYDSARPFAPWFFRIAHRLLVDDARRAFRTYEVPILERDPQGEEQSGEERLANREQVDRLLERLSPEEWYVLVGAKVEGVDYPDLAVDLGRSVVAVRKMASRALRKLRAGADAETAEVALHGRWRRETGWVR